MSASDPSPTDEEAVLASRSSLRRWFWPLAGIAAIIVFEVTANLSLAAFVFCLRFGAKELRSALWIAWNDRFTPRLLGLGFLYSALAALKIVIGSTGVAVLLAVILAIFDKPGAGPFGPVEVAMLTALCGLTVTFVLTLAGLLIAWGGKQRLWVDSRLARNIPFGYPPQVFGPRNEIRTLLFTLAILVFVAVTTIGITIVGQLPLRADGGWVAFGVILSLVGGVSVAFASVILLERLAASSPGECWPELDNPAFRSDPHSDDDEEQESSHPAALTARRVDGSQIS